MLSLISRNRYKIIIVYITGQDPVGVFQKVLPDLSPLLGERATFSRVTDKLVAKNLITNAQRNAIQSQPNLTDEERGSNAAHHLLDKIKGRHKFGKDPAECLLSICEVFEEEEGDLGDYGELMRRNLSGKILIIAKSI